MYIYIHLALAYLLGVILLDSSLCLLSFDLRFGLRVSSLFFSSQVLFERLDSTGIGSAVISKNDCSPLFVIEFVISKDN